LIGRRKPACIKKATIPRYAPKRV